MKSEIDKMREKILLIADPNSSYTQEDFDKEFSYTNMDVSFDYGLELQFLNTSDNPNPEYATNGSSGFDLRANLVEPIVIQPFKREIVPTGLFFKIPDNFEIQVRPRSGLAAKYGVTVLNTPGTVDADYRGEVKVILINLGDEPFTISHGDRIAQGVFASVISKQILKLKEVDSIETTTERGVGGFGSTGKN